MKTKLIGTVLMRPRQRACLREVLQAIEQNQAEAIRKQIMAWQVTVNALGWTEDQITKGMRFFRVDLTACRELDTHDGPKKGGTPRRMPIRDLMHSIGFHIKKVARRRR